MNAASDVRWRGAAAHNAVMLNTERSCVTAETRECCKESRARTCQTSPCSLNGRMPAWRHRLPALSCVGGHRSRPLAGLRACQAAENERSGRAGPVTLGMHQCCERIDRAHEGARLGCCACAVEVLGAQTVPSSDRGGAALTLLAALRQVLIRGSTMHEIFTSGKGDEPTRMQSAFHGSKIKATDSPQSSCGQQDIMVGRPQRLLNASSLAAQELVVLDLTSWQHLQALPDDLGIVTSLSSVCLAGAPLLRMACGAPILNMLLGSTAPTQCTATHK